MIKETSASFVVLQVQPSSHVNTFTHADLYSQLLHVRYLCLRLILKNDLNV